MKKETDLSKIKEVSICLLNAVPVRADKDIPFIANHPYTDSPILTGKDESGKYTVWHLTEKGDYEKWIRHMGSVIADAKDIRSLYCFVCKPYKLTFLKFAKPYMSNPDFSEYFGLAWTESENPNMDVNCNLRTLTSWFKNVDKEKLMMPSDYQKYKKLPEKMTVYRGVAVGRNPSGLSWTDNKKVADWFSHRFDVKNETGYVQKAEISKDNVLAYFSTRNEDEIVVNTHAIKDKIQII